MRLIFARNLGLVVLSAILQVASFPVAGPLPSWASWLSWFSLVPLLLVLGSISADGRPSVLARSAFAGYVCGVLWYGGNCYWVYQTMYLYGGLPRPLSMVILLLFSLYLGIYHALFGFLFAVIRGATRTSSAALFLGPFLWVGVELGRARITGFPWDLLGYTQIDNHLLLRFAPIGGVMLISFVVCLVNSVGAYCFVARSKTRAIVVAVAIALVLVFQIAGRDSGASPLKPEFTAVLLQQNLAVGNAEREVRPLSLHEELQVFSSVALNAAKSPRMRLPSVVVWPEAPSHLQSNDPAFRQSMTDLARAANAPLIIGSLGVDLDPVVSRGYYLYDSASLFNASGDYQGRYDKIHLVPWGEYVPFKTLFSFASKLTEGVGDMDRGERRTVFSVAGHVYGVFICYESIFGDEVREFVRNGAEVLVNISDDGWYGDTGAPWQHLNMARMRAVENQRWVLRDTNTGVTCVIDPEGRVSSQAPRHTRGAYLFPFNFRPSSSLTFYTRYGDWFAYICCAVTLVGVLLAGRRLIV